MIELRIDNECVRTIDYHHPEGELSYEYKLPARAMKKRHAALLHPSLRELAMMTPEEARVHFHACWSEIQSPHVKKLRDLLLGWEPHAVLVADPLTWVEQVIDGESKGYSESPEETWIEKMMANFDIVTALERQWDDVDQYEARQAEYRDKLDQARLQQLENARAAGVLERPEKPGESWFVFLNKENDRQYALLPVPSLPVSLPDGVSSFRDRTDLEELFRHFGGLSRGLPPHYGLVLEPALIADSPELYGKDAWIGALHVHQVGNGDQVYLRSTGEVGRWFHERGWAEANDDAVSTIARSFGEFVEALAGFFQGSEGALSD